MAYTINKTDGTILTDVLDGTIDKITTDLVLVGKSTSNYGEYFNENFIKLLENFANAEEPRAPLKGQIWYDSGENKLKFFNGSSFKEFSRPIVSPTEPTLTPGDLWIDSSKRQLYFNDGQGNKLAGPIYTAQQGLSGNQIVNIIDINGTSNVVIKFKIGNTLVGVFAKQGFTPNYDTTEAKVLQSEGYTGTIVKGFNPVSMDFKFNVTVKNAENLVTQFGEPINVDQFVKTTGLNNINGRLEITGNDLADPNFSKPLTLGYSSNLTFEIASLVQGSTELPPVRIKTQVMDQNLTLTVKNALGFRDAIFIDSNNSRVGIYNTDPLATLDIDGNVNFRQNLVTNKTTISLFNTTANTINFGSESTLMNIGSNIGDTIVNNNLIVNRDVLIQGGDLNSSTPTFNLINNVSTTINLGGGANTINVGSPISNVNFAHNVNINGILNTSGEIQIDNLLLKNNAVTATNSNNLNLNAFDGEIFLEKDSTALQNFTISKRLIFDGLGIISVPSGFTRTFQLLDTVVDKIQFGGDATDIQIGSFNGFTSVKNNLQVYGDISIGEADSTPATIDSNGPLVHLFNRTAQEIYIGAKAKEVNILYDVDTQDSIGKILNIYAEDTYFDGDIITRGGDISVPDGIPNVTLFNTGASRVTIGGAANTIELGGSGTVVKAGRQLVVGQVTGDVTIRIDASSGTASTGKFEVSENVIFFDLLPANVLNLNLAASSDRIYIGKGILAENDPFANLWQPALLGGSVKTWGPFQGRNQLPAVIIRQNLLIRDRLIVPEIDTELGAGNGAGVLYKNSYNEIDASKFVRMVGSGLVLGGSIFVSGDVTSQDPLGSVSIPRPVVNNLVVKTALIPDTTTTSIDIFNTQVETINFAGKSGSVVNLGSATSTLNVPGYIKRTWKTVTTTRQAVAGDLLIVDTSSFNVTITLPLTAELGDEISFADRNGIGSRKLVINRNGHKINGLEENLEITTPNRIFTLTYTGTIRGWCWDKEFWKTITANYTAVNGDKLLIDTTVTLGSSLLITLPGSPQTGDTVRIIDQKGLSAIKPLIIQRNGSLINGTVNDLTFTNSGAAFTLVYTGSTRGWCYDNA